MSEEVCKFVRRVEWDEPSISTEMRTIDEIVTGPVSYVHIERMSEGHFWMAVGKGSDRQIISFFAKGNKCFATTEKD